MGHQFEKRVTEMLQEEKEIPQTVRTSLDCTYEAIRLRTKRKPAHRLKKWTAVAAGGFAAIGMLAANDHVTAGFSKFFHIQDEGVQRAAKEGFTTAETSAVTDQNVEIRLTRSFGDANRLGLSLEVQLAKLAVPTDNVQSMSFEYRLKNGDGTYLVEYVSDTKPLKGSSPGRISTSEEQSPVARIGQGKAEYEFVLEARDGNMPKLQGAVLEIESIHFLYQDGSVKTVEGAWHLAVSDSRGTSEKLIQYHAAEPEQDIRIEQASLSETSLQLVLSVRGEYPDENTFTGGRMKVRADGKEFVSKGYSAEIKDGRTKVIAHFPVTSYEKPKLLTLVVEGLGSVDMERK